MGGPVSSDGANPADGRQSELIRAMPTRFTANVWQMECDKITAKICPQRQGKAVITDSRVEAQLQTFSCRKAPTFARPEKASYKPLATYLNAMVQATKNMADQLRPQLLPGETSGPYLKNIQFTVFDRPAADNIGSAARLKPDIIATTSAPPIDPNFPAYWILPEEPIPNACQIAMVVEVKRNWKALLAQIATYARAAFVTSPLRRFVVYMGVRHDTREFCIFVFHSGGALASIPLKLASTPGRLSLARFFLAIQLWTSPQDAGEPEYTDGTHFLLPSPIEGQPAIRIKQQRVLALVRAIGGSRTFVVRGAVVSNEGEVEEEEESDAPVRVASAQPAEGTSSKLQPLNRSYPRSS